MKLTPALSPTGKLQLSGLVRGLRLGPNRLVVRVTKQRRIPARKRVRGASLTITNHPIGGPVFAGKQVQPWLCTTADNGLGPALDAQCNAPTKVTWLYQPTGADPGAYESYDPANPPTDVATTETDAGVTVPYIVRQEDGTFDRTIYKVMVLDDPSKPRTPLHPPKGWSGKLFVAFAGGCGTPHKQNPRNPNTGFFGNTPGDGQVEQPSLIAKGWMVSGSGLLSYNQNCNEVVSAEAVMMMKERITETYGQIRHTVSVGGSGGSVQQINMAASYPGLLDGIVPTQSFPDLWQLVGDSAECNLLKHYFVSAALVQWANPLEQLAVYGKTGPVACLEFNAMLSDSFDPQNRGPAPVALGNGLPPTSVRPGCQLPADELYSPTTNPHGVRCSVQDYQASIWGERGPLNAAPLPYDNTGLQYGLGAMESGTISVEQFLDLNEHIGGLNNEGEFTAERSMMDLTTAQTMYRSGRTTDAHALADVPIVDIREATVDQTGDTTSDMHQAYNSSMLRARLDAANGGHGNYVYWNVAPENMDLLGVLAVDRWLDAVERDPRPIPRSQKIVEDRPADVMTTCWVNQAPITGEAACDSAVPHGTDPRIVAGEPLTGDNHKCQLRTPVRGDYATVFTDSQWSRLMAAFPGGVCDFSKPPVAYQRAQTWVSYAAGPGGVALGSPPSSRPLKKRKR